MNAAESRESDVRQVLGSDTREDAAELLRRLRVWLANGYGVTAAERALPSLELIEQRCAMVADCRRYTLPSGAVADLRPGAGRDLRQAARLVEESLPEDQRDPFMYELASLSVRVLVDGQPVTLTSLLEGTISDDLVALLGILRGKVPSDTERARGGE